MKQITQGYFPAVHKIAIGGYDGQGVVVINESKMIF